MAPSKFYLLALPAATLLLAALGAAGTDGTFSSSSAGSGSGCAFIEAEPRYFSLEVGAWRSGGGRCCWDQGHVI